MSAAIWRATLTTGRTMRVKVDVEARTVEGDRYPADIDAADAVAAYARRWGEVVRLTAPTGA
jgi:hypothetical protein